MTSDNPTRTRTPFTQIFQNALAQRQKGDLETAANSYRSGIEQIQKKHSDLLHRLQSQDEDQTECRKHALCLAEAMDALANILRLLIKKRHASELEQKTCVSDPTMQEARKAAEQALEIRKTLKMNNLVAQSMTSLSLLYYACEDMDEAFVLHREALGIFAEIPSRCKPVNTLNEEEKVETTESPAKGEGYREAPKVVLPTLNEEARKSWEAFKARRPDVKRIALTVAQGSSGDKYWEDWKAFSTAKAARMASKREKVQKEDSHLGFIEKAAFAVAFKAAQSSIPRPMFVANVRKKLNQEHTPTDPVEDESETKEEPPLERRGEAGGLTNNKRRNLPVSKVFVLECLGDLSCTTPEDSVPPQIELDPEVADVISFGRRSLNEQKKESKGRSSLEESREIEDGKDEEEIIESAQHRYKNVKLDCSVHEKLISRRHAMLKYTRMHRLVPLRKQPKDEESSSPPTYDWAWVIRDLGSTNGVLVNGVRVKEHPLQPNDVISFGGAATVGFGCSVQTHKRKPVSSIFVYKFCEKKRSEEESPGETIPTSVESVTFRRTHFELLFSNIVNDCFKNGRQGVEQLRTALEWRNKCEEIYAKAKRENVPLVHWTGWIKAKLCEEHLLANT